MYRYGPYPVAYPGDNPNLLSDALCVDDNVIGRVYFCTLFGIVIQCNLKLNAHVDQICATFQQIVGAI